jgi:starvation-inducible outer membrane lipoprotein
MRSTSNAQEAIDIVRWLTGCFSIPTDIEDIRSQYITLSFKSMTETDAAVEILARDGYIIDQIAPTAVMIELPIR